MAQMWSDLTTLDFTKIDADRTVAVLPVAAVEQHGPHLPVGTDASINTGIVQAAMAKMSENFPAIILPMTHIGKSDEHISFPGTLTLSYETLARVWYETGASIFRAGIRKILFFNSHGGQPQLLEIVCRDLRVKLGAFAATASWPRITKLDDLFSHTEIKHGIHGGQIETSIMLHLQPEKVKMPLAENFEPLSAAMEREAGLLGSGAAYFGWQTQDLHQLGACGNATLATAALGEIVVERAATGLISLIEEVSRFPLSRLTENPLKLPDFGSKTA